MSDLDPNLVHLFGHREMLALDGRHRFRLPDEVARSLEHELGRLSGKSNLPPAAFQRLAFYFVPGTIGRIFVFPTANINVAIGRFENPPPGQDPAQIRAARDYFFSMMCFVEADRQNRVQIPEDLLLKHAGIKADDKQIVLVCHDLWMAISSEQAAKEEQARGREAFEAVGQNVLDPVFGSSSVKGEKEESC